ncbi:MAG: EscU/YscU/HrcU family type III secretion system export apparatus switch protein [Anaplasmataceae bacterium]|nr:EscU/YscU/HrcU family type III secretion system export apparatus switch protein [Anaplasmataceae bacterium]
MSEDKDSKTEEPTQKKLEDERKKGNIYSSKELSNFIILLVYSLIFLYIIPDFFKLFTFKAKSIIELNYQMLDMPITNLFRDLFLLTFKKISIPCCLLCLTIIVTHILQHGFALTIDPIIPKFSKVSLSKGLGRLFSTKSLMTTLFSIAKIAFVIYVVSKVTMAEINNILASYDYSFYASLNILYKIVLRSFLYILIVMFFLTAIDLLYRIISHKSSLKMSKQDIKDENKNSDGNPEVKAKLRSMAKNIVNQNIKAGVEKSNVVITNPTHFAVAIQYQENMNAPIITAKGRDYIALQIKEIAMKNYILIVENKKLARDLYHNGEVNQLIPENTYRAVAEIIHQMHKLQKQ